MRAVLWLIGLALAALGVYFFSQMIPLSGAFATLEPRLVAQCRPVDIFPGTEDVIIDPDLGVAFISADDRRATQAGAPVQGGIYTLRLDGSDRVSRVSPDSFGEFHPHGISLWSSPEGMKRLFAVNHTIDEGDKVEIFDVGFAGALIHVDTISFGQMSSANDVLAVGPRSFYVTNDKGFKTGFMNTVEAYLALPFSSVAFFDGQNGSIAAKGLAYANGINMSANGRNVYVSELLRRRIVVYERDTATNALKRLKTLRVNTAPDNIELDERGGLWVGGHPKVFDFLKHVEDPAAVAPSTVVHINPATGESEDVFVDTDGILNASSVGAASGDTLIVGAVFDDHVMVCPLD
ncbi:MAG: SMP-30/gluconolactonase/LRE family protein [Parvularculaceae bacterium]|nr:SMP-30/gluconolactonase/LRE family protein [Parvularculaceae bacterium]